jgi:hypothetical protein
MTKLFNCSAAMVAMAPTATWDDCAARRVERAKRRTGTSVPGITKKMMSESFQSLRKQKARSASTCNTSLPRLVSV